MPTPTYSIKNSIWLVRDRDSETREENIKRHIAAGDYFGTLATILDLTKQSYEELGSFLARAEEINKKNLEVIENLKNDLIFLEDRFKINKK